MQLNTHVEIRINWQHLSACILNDLEKKNASLNFKLFLRLKNDSCLLVCCQFLKGTMSPQEDITDARGMQERTRMRLLPACH